MFTSRLPCYAPVHLNKVDLPLPVLPTTLTRCPGVRFKQSLRRTKGMFSRYRKEMSCSAHLSPVVRNFIPTYRPTWWKPPRSEPKSIDLLRKLDWVVLFFTLELDGPMLGGGCVGFPKKSPVMSNSISQSCLASDHFPPKMRFKHGDCPTMFDYGRID